MWYSFSSYPSSSGKQCEGLNTQSVNNAKDLSGKLVEACCGGNCPAAQICTSTNVKQIEATRGNPTKRAMDTCLARLGAEKQTECDALITKCIQSGDIKKCAIEGGGGGTVGGGGGGGGGGQRGGGGGGRV